MTNRGDKGMEDNNTIAKSFGHTTENQFLVFNIANVEYGVEIAYVKEIIKVCSITKVPHTKEYVKGIINLRGDIIPVVSVREKFRHEAKEYDANTCIIVLDYDEISIGLIVDGVNEVMYIHTDNINPPPSDKYGYTNSFIKNIGKTEDTVKQIVDLNKMLSE